MNNFNYFDLNLFNKVLINDSGKDILMFFSL